MRFKSVVSGFLTFALLVGAPGLPCWQASAQMVVKGRVTGVPYKAGYVTGTQLPRSLKLDAFKSFSLTPSLPPTSLTLAPSVVLQDGVALPQTVLPASAITQVDAGPVAEEANATFFQTLQTLGAGLAQDAAKNGDAATDEKLAQSFDGAFAKKTADAAFTAKTTGWGRAASGLKKRTALIAASTVLAVPAFSQTAQTAAEQPSGWGPVAVIGLSVVGLSLFVYNMVQAAKGWTQMRTLERDWRWDVSNLQQAHGSRERLQAQVKDIPGVRPVIIKALGSGNYELVVFFKDPAALESAVVPSVFEALPVRKQILTADAVKDILTGPREPKNAKKSGGGLKGLLTLGLSLGAGFAAKAAPVASAMADSGGSDFSWGLLWFGLSLLWGRSMLTALAIGVIASTISPLLALAVLLLFTSPEKKDR